MRACIMAVARRWALPWLVLAGMLPATTALARFGSLPLDIVVGESAVVADATILSARVAEYNYRHLDDSCGFIYEARVAESFKGHTSRTLTFASNLPMEPGSRQLLFLRSYAGDFPSDVRVYLEDEEDPGFDAGVTRARARCLAGLPRLKGNFLHAGEIVPRFELGADAVSVSRWIALLPDLAVLPARADQRADERLVEWSLLRAWLLRHVADIADASSAAESCDARCTAAAARQTQVVMDRNLLAARREFRDRVGAVAALDAAQRRWQDFANAECTLLAQVDRPGQPPRSCHLWLTQARSRELWLQRLLSPLDGRAGDCDEACVEETLGHIAESTQIRLTLVRDLLPDGTLDAGQQLWDSYAESNCQAAAAGRDDSSRSNLAMACQLRMGDARRNELYGRLYRFADE